MSKKIDKILGRIAIGGGMLTIGTGFFLYNRLQRQYSYEFFVREPVKLLREYPYAEQLLGKPIIAKNIKFDHDNVQVTQIRAKVNIPVKGTKGRAMLYSLSERETPDAEWEVKQLELQLDPKTPKWTFYKQAGPGTSDPSVTTSQTDTETSKEQLQKNSADSSEQQLDKGEKKDTERTEKQTLLETEKKKLKWL